MYSAIQAAADSNCSRDKINPRFFVLKEPGICYLLKWDFKEVMQRFNRCSDSTKISSCVLEKNKEWQFQVFSVPLEEQGRRSQQQDCGI